MKSSDRKALKAFFRAVRVLLDSEVIRTHRYLGDIGEFLCTIVYSDFKRVKGKRQEGFDARWKGKRVQVKFHNSPKWTNVSLGKPSKYDYVIVVVGPHSKLHPRGDATGQFLFFRFTSQRVKNDFARETGFSCGKGSLGAPEHTFTL